MLFTFTSYLNIHETGSREFRTDVPAETEGAVTADWIVFQIFTKHDKQSINFLFLVINCGRDQIVHQDELVSTQDV